MDMHAFALPCFGLLNLWFGACNQNGAFREPVDDVWQVQHGFGCDVWQRGARRWLGAAAE